MQARRQDCIVLSTNNVFHVLPYATSSVKPSLAMTDKFIYLDVSITARRFAGKFPAHVLKASKSLCFWELLVWSGQM